ncbi:MAG: HNH endonuclease [Pseudomonadales bacterium]|nr:HNH endonuclease [Pseudomonadales bacterium]
MTARPVEWVLVVFYGPEAHRAAYGRQVRSNRYTKDYIQLSRKPDFLDAVTKLFRITGQEETSVSLTYKWPDGSTPGAFVFNSADRPHLKWETALGAPQVWKMSLHPGEQAAETIPGDPSHLEFDDAERELDLLAERGGGQPYLMAIKLQDEPRTLHLRAYLDGAEEGYQWAALSNTPPEIQELAHRTSRGSALAWSVFQSGGIAPGATLPGAVDQLEKAENIETAVDALEEKAGRALAGYLRQPGYGLFFDPTENHDAWIKPLVLPESVESSAEVLATRIFERFPELSPGDAAAEELEVSTDEVEAFERQMADQDFSVDDSLATVKTRGSAQRVFSEAVKTNYEFTCAITGIRNRQFLVASHIVPWSKDPDIRLDPANGICLSLLVDRAFENGYIIIEDDLTIRVDWQRVGDDESLREQLGPHDGQKLRSPVQCPPDVQFLKRRRDLVAMESSEKAGD